MVLVRKILQVSTVGVIALAFCAATLMVVQEHTVIPQLSLATALHAEDVAVFLKAASADDVERLLRHVRPDLRQGVTVPRGGSGSYEVALLVRGEDERWILQSTTRTDTQFSGTGTGWLLKRDEPRIRTLFTAPEYKRMVREHAPAVWMRSSALALTSADPDAVLSALLSPYAALQWSEQARTLALVRTERRSKSGSAGWMPVFNADTQHVYLADDQLGSRIADMQTALATMNPGMTEGWAGALRYQLQLLLGEDAATLAEQLPKALHALRIEDGSGGLVGAAVFRNIDPAVLKGMEDGFAALQPQTSLRTLTLQKNERVDIAVDAGAVQHEYEVHQGWDVISIRSQAAGTELVIARRGGWTVIGTAKAMVLDMLSAQETPVVAGGSMHGEALASAVTRLLPALRTREPSLLWSLLAKDIDWKLATLPDADILMFTGDKLD